MTHQEPPMLPSFFKILLDPSGPHLTLPPDFVRKHLKNKISQNPILQSVNEGYSWRLKIKKADKVYSFADGWNKVVEDTQMVFGDFLVFWLVDQSTFKVLVFGTNGCEKHFPSNIKDQHGDDDAEEEEEEVEEGGGGGSGSGSGDEEEDDNGGSDEVDPFFTTIISKGYKYRLRLPMEFVQLAGIDKERIITMKNQSGEEWRVSLRSESNHPGRYYLSAGWINFRRVNQLSEGDECVIKFIRSEDKLCVEKVTKQKQLDGKGPVAKAVERPRGRPPKKQKTPTGKVMAAEVLKRPIGRPPCVVVVGKYEGVELVKRSRGRPPTRKKTPARNAPAAEVMKRPIGRPSCAVVEGKDEGVEVVKRSRGRPRKKKQTPASKVPTTEVLKRERLAATCRGGKERGMCGCSEEITWKAT